MNSNPLHLAVRHGRSLLVIGLIAGIAFPALGLQIRPFLQELIAVLLFLAALRIGPQNMARAVTDLPKLVTLGIIFQIVMPLAIIAVFAFLGMLGATLAAAIILIAAAPSISGSPNLTLMVGGDPAPALKLLVVTTALVPLTIIPVFYWMPDFREAGGVFQASGRLLLVIAVSTTAAFIVRRFWGRDPSAAAIKSIDGLSAITMAVLVIGLMSSAGPTLSTDPGVFFYWLGVAFAVNFGMQIASYFALVRSVKDNETVPFSIIAGNRNSALFLVALPAEVIEPILLYIGCYQIPMYLTPLVLKRLYSR